MFLIKRVVPYLINQVNQLGLPERVILFDIGPLKGPSALPQALTMVC